ncbi:MAG: SCO family protein [Bdellovibrionales bacterium]|nr:SCO family protein [Bdellovibrionales bacterium]
MKMLPPVLLALVLVFVGCTRKQAPKLPPYAAYTFQDQDGKNIKFERFKGKPTFASFIFTRCPMADMCPLTMQKTKKVYDKVKAEGLSANFVVFTIDPVFDTPEVMTEYAKRYQLNLNDFTLLTGTDESVSKIASELANVIAIPSANYITHNVKSVLLNANLEVVEEYKDNEWKPEDVITKLKTL